MAKKTTLKGLSNVLRNLNKEIRDIRFHTKAGLTEAAQTVKRDSVKMTPVDTSNLRGSCFIKVTGDASDNPAGDFRDGKNVDTTRLKTGHQTSLAEMSQEVNKVKYKYSAVVAYSAFYAWWVHEMPATSNFNRGENQFLLKSLTKNQEKIRKILARHARF